MRKRVFTAQASSVFSMRERLQLSRRSFEVGRPALKAAGGRGSIDLHHFRHFAKQCDGYVAPYQHQALLEYEHDLSSGDQNVSLGLTAVPIGAQNTQQTNELEQLRQMQDAFEKEGSPEAAAITLIA